MQGEERTSRRAWPVAQIIQEHLNTWRMGTEARFQRADWVEGNCSGQVFGRVR